MGGGRRSREDTGQLEGVDRHAEVSPRDCEDAGVGSLELNAVERDVSLDGDGTGPRRIAAVGREAGLDGQVRTERRGLEKPRRHTNGRVRRADEVLDRQLLDPDGAAERRRYRAGGTDHGDRARWDGQLQVDPAGIALAGEPSHRRRDSHVERRAFLQQGNLRVGEVEGVHRPAPGRCLARRCLGRCFRRWRLGAPAPQERQDVRAALEVDDHRRARDVDGRHPGPMRCEIDRLDPDRQALDRERRLRDVGHADRHVPEPHHAAELVPRGGGDRMVDRGVELAGELAPADPGDVEPRAMERDAKRFEMGRDREPLIEHPEPALDPEHAALALHVHARDAGIAVEAGLQRDVGLLGAVAIV